MMRRWGTSWRPLVAALAALLVLALGLGACAQRVTEVDPNFVFPEGHVSDDSQLVLWYDVPVEVREYADATEPPGPDQSPFCPNSIFPDPGDPVVRTQTFRFNPTGSINLTILDHSPATAFRPMRREANGGYRTLLDFPLPPTRKWLENQWELYSYSDSRPSGFDPPTYVGRGSVGGLQSASSPLTNQAELRIATPGDIRYTGRCLPCDSLFTLRWDAVPGVFRYWLHVYQVASGASETELVKATRPSPINDVRPRDLLLAYVGDSVASYRLGDVARHDIVRLVERTPAYNQSYRVRIAAVDSLGQLIAITRGDFGTLGRGENYALMRLNAYIVTTKRPSNSPPFCQTETGPDFVVDTRDSGHR
jgi:hypothetical protein